jgi:hypothetical protein
MLNTGLRLLLLVWVLGYLVISCGGIVNGDLGGGLLGMVAGAVLFVPWLIGVVVLALLVWLTNPSRRF